MARVELKQPEELSAESKKAYDELNSKGKITNMKLAMLQDYGTYLAFMGWYDSWGSLVNVVGQRAATIYAHSVSTTNGCLLCSLFFISDLKELGLDPNNLVLDEKEQLLHLCIPNPECRCRISWKFPNPCRQHQCDQSLIP